MTSPLKVKVIIYFLNEETFILSTKYTEDHYFSINYIGCIFRVIFVANLKTKKSEIVYNGSFRGFPHDLCNKGNHHHEEGLDM